MRALLEDIEHGRELRLRALRGQQLESDTSVALLHLVPRCMVVSCEADRSFIAQNDEALVGPSGVVSRPPVTPGRGVLRLIRPHRGRDIRREGGVVERRWPEGEAA